MRQFDDGTVTIFFDLNNGTRKMCHIFGKFAVYREMQVVNSRSLLLTSNANHPSLLLLPTIVANGSL